MGEHQQKSLQKRRVIFFILLGFCQCIFCLGKKCNVQKKMFVKAKRIIREKTMKHWSCKILENVIHFELKNFKTRPKNTGIYFTKEMKHDFSKIDIGLHVNFMNLSKTRQLLKFF